MSEPEPSPGLPGAQRLLALLGVLALISIVVGVAYALAILPEVRAQRMIANEGAAVQGLTRIKTAQTLFREQPGRERYGDLFELEQAGLLETGYATQPRQGYRYEAGPGLEPGRRWWAKASPQFPGKTGREFFYVDQDGLVYHGGQDFPVPPSGAPPPGLKLLGQ